MPASLRVTATRTKCRDRNMTEFNSHYTASKKWGIERLNEFSKDT